MRVGPPGNGLWPSKEHLVHSILLRGMADLYPTAFVRGLRMDTGKDLSMPRISLGLVFFDALGSLTSGCGCQKTSVLNPGWTAEGLTIMSTASVSPLPGRDA